MRMPQMCLGRLIRRDAAARPRACQRAARTGPGAQTGDARCHPRSTPRLLPGRQVAFQPQLLLSQPSAGAKGCRKPFCCWPMPCSSQPPRLQLQAGGRGRSPGERAPFTKILFPFPFSAPPQPCPSHSPLPPPTPDNELLSCAALRAK